MFTLACCLIHVSITTILFVALSCSDATQAEKSETESEGSHKIGKDYEIIDREEVNDSDGEQDDDEDKED